MGSRLVVLPALPALPLGPLRALLRHLVLLAGFCLLAAMLPVAERAAAGGGGGESPPQPIRPSGQSPPQLAYASGGDLWLIAADGQGRRRLTDHGDPTRPIGPQLAWSPDGTKLAYPSRAYGFGPPVGKLFIVDVATGQETLVAQDTGELAIAWAPGGRALLVVGFVAAAPSSALHRIDLASGTLASMALPLDAAGKPPCVRIWSISPDTSWLAYEGAGGTLRIRSLETGVERDLGVPPAAPPLGGRHELCYGVAWSPGSDWLAWTQLTSGLPIERRTVWVLRREAGGVDEAVSAGTLVGGKGPTDVPAVHRHLWWSPDGAWLDSPLRLPQPIPSPVGGATPPPAGWPGLTACASADSACPRRAGAYRWSPDGKWIEYPAGRPLPAAAAAPGVPAVIWPAATRLANLEGTADVELAATTGAVAELYEAHLASPFSADAAFAYYVTPEGELRSVMVETGATFPLAALGCPSGFPDRCFAGAAVPAWRPGGR